MKSTKLPESDQPDLFDVLYCFYCRDATGREYHLQSQTNYGASEDALP